MAALLEGYLAHLRQPATVPAPDLPRFPHAVSDRKEAWRPRLSRRTCLLAALGIVSLLALLRVTLGGKPERSPRPAEVPAPKAGLTCLLVNKNSGRCLSVAGGATNPGARIVQGPTPEKAGATERWVLLGSDKGFRLFNSGTRLVLEIGSANRDPGVQAIQWHDQVIRTNQHWTFEPVGDDYLLRVGHSRLVLSIGMGSLAEGATAIQWHEMPDVLDQLWEVRPVGPAGSRQQKFPDQRLLLTSRERLIGRYGSSVPLC